MLSNVMEFLDAIDSSESDFNVGESVGSESDGATPREAALVEMVRMASKPQHKSQQRKMTKSDERKQGPVPYTTELQRRKRSELLTRRQEGDKLNELLVQLHQSRHDRLAIAADGSDQASNGWRTLAAIESEERQRAERTNRELKVILASQQKTGAAIRKLLGKRSAFEVRAGLTYLCSLKSTVERFPARLDYSDTILGDLASSLDALRLDAGTALPVLESSTCSVVSHSLDKVHPTNGHRIAETTTMTPLACSVQHAGDVFWRFVSTDVDRSFYSIRKSNPHSFEMNCVVNSREGSQNIDGVVIYRRYDERDRSVIVGRFFRRDMAKTCSHDCQCSVPIIWSASHVIA